MNSSLLARKSVWNAALLASVGLTVLVTGTALREYPITTFSIAATTALLLIMLHDYAPPRRRWEPRLADRSERPEQSRSSQRCQLAA